MKICGRLITWLILVVSFQSSSGIMDAGQPTLEPVSVWADETWKQEFEEVCARAGDQEGLSADDLKALLGRCDALKTVIEGLEESTRKVYLARLQACRDLYRYMLDAKTQGGPR